MGPQPCVVNELVQSEAVTPTQGPIKDLVEFAYWTKPSSGQKPPFLWFLWGHLGWVQIIHVPCCHYEEFSPLSSLLHVYNFVRMALSLLFLSLMADGPRRLKFVPVKGDRWRHETVQGHISAPVTTHQTRLLT